MMWLDGNILQVYWNGYHHIAAYLGNILVWRENIRAVQSINYISAEVPSANTTLCLGVSSESFNKIVQSNHPNAVTSKAENIQSTSHADVQVYGDAFARAVRMPEGILPVSLDLDLVTVISALAKAATSKPDHGFIPTSNPKACESISTNIDNDTTFNPNNSIAQSRPAALQTGESLEQFSTDSSEGVSVPKTLAHIDVTESNFIFNGQPTIKEPSSAKTENINITQTSQAHAEIITWTYPVQYVSRLVVEQVYSATVKQDDVLGNILEVT